MSHDLRTPLASIKASATSLLQSDVAWDAEQRREFAETIDAEADRLNRLVGNLLDMSRLQAGAVQRRQPARLPRGRRRRRARLASTTTRTAWTSTCPRRCRRGHVDPTLLERALANVVANALAWSPRTAPVRIEAAEVARPRPPARHRPRPRRRPADRERVFQPFQRLGDRDSEGGVGLGLAVARGFVEAIGGTIELDDTPGGGLTVLIDLPVAPVPEESSAGSP